MTESEIAEALRPNGHCITWDNQPDFDEVAAEAEERSPIVPPKHEDWRIDNDRDLTEQRRLRDEDERTYREEQR